VNDKKLKSVLVLSDGTAYYGKGFGACEKRAGELVFNTSMTGYQEALSDPSYAGQMLLMSYPLIGNYGIDETSFESEKVHALGFCVREESFAYSHRNAKKSLHEFLYGEGVPGISGIDTRKIVRRIRAKGVMPAAMQTYEEGGEEADLGELQKMAQEIDYSGTDFVSKVSTKKEYFVDGIKTNGREGKIVEGVNKDEREGKKVVLIDCGVKRSIVQKLVQRGMGVHVVPAFTEEKEIRSLEPDGIVISNGPGDPARLTGISETIKRLFDFPIFGVCLGHQLLGQAAGAKTYKLKFGHRGANQPVLEKRAGKVFITSQNHGYAVDAEGLESEFEETHVNLNDGTNEGLAHKSLPIFSVQYHPEGSPGPHDSEFLFDKFAKYLEEG